MTSTPVSRRNGQRAPFSLVSPQSGPQKRQKRLSAGIALMQQSPDLPEVGENELRSSRQRRHSRNFSSILHLSKNSSVNAEELSEGRSNVRWTKDQLLQHYSQCMKLSQENKINHKNAFDLQLIEHMGEMIRQDGSLNFRVAGGTIFAGAKIYASRVDAVHSEIYRVLSSLSSGDKEEDAPDDDCPEEDPEKKVKKKKKALSKILETNEASLRVASISSSCAVDSMERLRGSAIDAASCDSAMANQVKLSNDEAMLLFDTKIQPKELPDNQPSENDGKSLFQTMLSNHPIGSNCQAECSCDTFKQLGFDSNNTEVNFASPKSSFESNRESQNSQQEIGEVDDFTCAEEDNFPDDAGDAADESVFQLQHGEKGARVEKQVEVTDVMDMAQWVAVAPQAEYSYFKPNLLSVFNGPAHWLRHKSTRSASSVTSSSDIQTDDPSQPKKRKVSEKSHKKKNSCDQHIVRDKRLQPQKTSKQKLESFKSNMRNQILLESSDFNVESILRATFVKVILTRLTPGIIKKAGVTVEDEGLSNFNYDNEEYCPATVDSDFGDEFQDENSRDMFPNTSEAFFPDFTQNVSNSSPPCDDAGASAAANYSALLDGDHLISQPRKVDTIQVHFAKRAKRIDVRRLKNAMWSIITEPGESPDLPTMQDSLNESEKPNEVPQEEADEEEVPKDTPEQAESVEQEKDEIATSGDSFLSFSDLYNKLPQSVSKTMSENLSVPLAFTCLLHLANEKQLKIEGMPTLSDLKITQEVTEK